MSDAFYRVVFAAGWPAFTLSGSPTVLHRERARRKGAYLLAATHFSPYDVPCIIMHTPRILDFVSVTEAFRHPLAAWFLRSVGAFALDRSKADAPTVRIILDRLERGRAVLIFPEGGLRTAQTSVLNGGELRPGVARIAALAGTPIVPCVIVGTEAYRRFKGWMPVRGTRYGLIYGEPIYVGEGKAREVEEGLPAIYRSLHAELREGMGA